MKRTVGFILVMSILLLQLCSCGIFNGSAPSGTDVFFSNCGVDFSQAKVTGRYNYNSASLRGGFSLNSFSYDDSGSEVTLEKQISENLKWRAYPLSKNVMQLFDSSIPAKYIPQTNSGYYFFYDMHKDSTDPFDDSKIFDRKDIKVVIALYIPEDRSLYIYDYHS